MTSVARHVVSLATVGFIVLAMPSMASAQSVRTFLKTTGNDGNPCSLAAPCRTLQAAVNAVADGGDVVILDSGAYGGGSTISKSVHIAAEPGVTARMKSVRYLPAITVNGANITVSIRNLFISGTEDYAWGLYFASGFSLILREVEIDTSGIETIGIFHGGSGANLILTDSVMRNSARCFYAYNPSVAQHATISHTKFTGCRVGVDVYNNSIVTVRNSVLSGGSADPTFCVANAYVNNGASLVIDNSSLTHCQDGAFGNASGTILSITNSLIASNTRAASVVSGASGRTSRNRVLVNSDNQMLNFTTLAPQ